jgi:Pentapeptide repeats (8 copies)
MTETTHRPFLDILTENRTLPDGYDSWGFKSVRADFTTYGGYRWPWPGTAVTDPTATAGDGDACPTKATGGLCVATTWRGVADGAHGHRCLLLLAYRAADILGRDDFRGKLRVKTCRVVELLDGEKMLAKATGANLTGAYLAGAYLADAYLTGANLAGAYLAGANLADAYLRDAYLTGAYLTGANLTGANLAGANLRDANLRDAYLRGAYLTGANLAGANLRDAYLRGAYLAGANLAGANLADAYLRDAYLTGARNLDKAIGYKAAP